MKRLTPREQHNLMDIVMLVISALCTCLIIYDIATLRFTPLTLVLDVIILIWDISFIVRFVKKKKRGL